LFFDDGVSSGFDVDGVGLVEERSDVIIGYGGFSEGDEAVELRHEVGVGLYGCDVFHEADGEVVEELCFEL